MNKQSLVTVNITKPAYWVCMAKFWLGKYYRDGFSKKVLETSPMPSKANAAESRMVPSPAKAGPIRDVGNTSGITYLRGRKVIGRKQLQSEKNGIRL